MFEAEEGQTLLEVAEKAGISIPVLCNRRELDHYSSCMVCLVKDKKKDSFIPSCSALVQEGMDIDASGEDVVSIRKKAIELLLLEHRAECEAQCRIVCPAGYNIPLMNRFLASGNTKAAAELILSEVSDAVIRCEKCPGYCENACRRKKVDQSVSIRNIRLYMFYNIIYKDSLAKSAGVQEDTGIRKRFSSRIGPLEESELKEWLKECKKDITRFREITNVNDAVCEAESCMHCDCRAADNCRLRDVADELNVKDPKGKVVNAQIKKKINFKIGLIFENAKCIKCGLCVRIMRDDKEETGLCFINRGFTSIISEPLTEEFDDILPTKSDICIDICPTGALSRFK